MSEQILTGVYENLMLDEIVLPAGNNPRDAEPQGHLFGLKDSFESIGQLNAIIVSKVDGKYYAVAGRRRIEAARQAGQTHIEAKVYNDLDQRTLLLMVAAENIHRKGFNAIEEARMIQMLEEEKFHIKVIATKLNMSVDTVRRKRNLLKLPDDIQQMITRKDNPLPTHQAQMLCGLSGEQQRRAARQIAPTTGPVATEKQAKKIIDDIIGGKLDMADPDDKHPSTAIAKKAAITKNTKKSKAAKEKSTREQKKACPKVDKNSKGIINLGEINWDIGGKAKLDIELHRINLEEATAFIKIGEQEITLTSPATLMLTPEETRQIVAALGKTALRKKDKKKSGEKKPQIICPKCGGTEYTTGFSCERGGSSDGKGGAKWKCLGCGKVFTEKDGKK
ncbi:MAG: ParB/RepB/Spo0J family partition protein [Sedimentisphaerales bacterium]|nr:ParB/RepB/Spo0J family partition protein [Sedimentisphaerales bacterium]